jgi:hypothetical protein
MESGGEEENLVRTFTDTCLTVTEGEAKWGEWNSL